MVARETSRFEVIPAIDLRSGRVVCLRQGDFEREQVFDDDPSSVAARFVDGGARWLHVVDLDGARDGTRSQAPVIAAIVARVGGQARTQVAGGLRAETAVDDALLAGAARVVVGTAALTDPAFAGRLVERHGADRVAVAIDVRDGEALGHGWVSGSSGVPAIDAVSGLAAVGIRTFIVTAIERDGLLSGPDLDLLGRAIDAANPTGAQVIASGGIASIADLEACRQLGASGAIVGRALYTGDIHLAEAIGTLSRDP